MNPLRIATRGSDLALTQARWIASRIERELGRESEIVVVRTTGDRIQDRSLAKIGGKGLFVKEIEEALLEGRADVAVHSAKDVPARIAEGCVLAAFPERVDARDALVARTGLVAAGVDATLAKLPAGVRVGTGSTRRVALLRALRSDLEIVPLRGNVPTRLDRVREGDLDAVVLACAGLDRLGHAERIAERIDPGVMLPAIGQGLLALETRADDAWAERLQALEPAHVAPVARAERAFQIALGGDCSTPMAGHAVLDGQDELWLRGLVASLDGRRIARAERRAPVGEAENVGRALAEAVLAAGGAEILREIEAAEAEAGG